jgi:predicted RecB family nuclease
MPEQPLSLDAARHLAGLQCELRLWREVRDPSGADPAVAAERANARRARSELRELAAQMLPGATRDHVFRAGRLEARADFLVRDSDGKRGVRAVRAALRPNESHLDELAFVRTVAAASGEVLGSVGVLHLDADFVRGAGPVEPRALFKHTDVTKDVAFLARDLRARLESQLRLLDGDAPAVEPSPHCRRPSSCSFWKRCTEARSADWIGHLPSLRPQAHAAFVEASVGSIPAIADDFPLTAGQRNARRALARGGAVVTPELAGALAELGPAPDFLDFEAILPELPLFPGTRPLEAVPFQWSAHLTQPGGGVEHREYLADGRGDPRRGFAQTLLETLEHRSGRIAVYSGFEAEVLEQLARSQGDLAPRLDRLRARLFDLLPVVRRAVYHPAFLGSFSLKRVAPVLAGVRFDDLPGIADGGAASREWHALARGELSPEDGARVLAELRAYCARDSLALVELTRALRTLAADPRHSSP